MGFRIAVDVGGTFTDVAIADQTGRLTLGKALSTHEHIFSGLSEALDSAARSLDCVVPSLLRDSDLLVYGTTQATNATIEGTTARTAFLVTAGFPDILVRREGGKLNPFDFGEPYPVPYVPRHLTYEVDERTNAEGEVITPLNEEQARAILSKLAQRKVEAVAVCFLWSIVNGENEEAMGALLEDELPGVPYTLSHRLNPIIREYRRASSAAIDASLKPLMQRHLAELERDLREAGFTGELLAAISVGGVMHLADLIQRPLYAVKSGPALAPVAGRTYADAEFGAADVIVCDTGGTSFDVSLIRGGQIVFTRETWLGSRLTGHLTGLSSVDVRSIGAGGGSIAWIDSGGLLRVGPQSAGADPGPACYGRGDSYPTVTDAALCLGYLDPDTFLGGKMRLDLRAARQVLGEVSGRLGLSVEQTAEGVLAIANEQIVQAIREITVNEGVDPRQSLVVAGGGAAGLSIVPIVRELGCKRVLIPRTAGALSACGAQFSDIVAEFSASCFTTSAAFEFESVNDTLGSLGRSIERFSEGLQQHGLTRARTEYFAEAHYPSQVWNIDIPLGGGRFETEIDVEVAVETFHAAHERVFAVKEPGQQVEFINWKGRLTVALDRPPLVEMDRDEHASVEPVRRRIAHFADAGAVETSIYEGSRLPVGAVVGGPAVIEEPTTTIVVYPDSSAQLSKLGNYVVDC